MLIADLPTAPWQKVGIDLFHLHCKDYLLVIDYQSHSLSSHTWKGFSTDMESHNVSSVTTGPNMTVVNSTSLQCNVDFNISPLVACINPQMDRLKIGVQIVKRLLTKASDSKTDPYLALLSYRTASLQAAHHNSTHSKGQWGQKLKTSWLTNGWDSSTDRKWTTTKQGGIWNLFRKRILLGLRALISGQESNSSQWSRTHIICR